MNEWIFFGGCLVHYIADMKIITLNKSHNHKIRSTNLLHISAKYKLNQLLALVFFFFCLSIYYFIFRVSNKNSNTNTYLAGLRNFFYQEKLLHCKYCEKMMLLCGQQDDIHKETARNYIILRLLTSVIVAKKIKKERKKQKKTLRLCKEYSRKRKFSLVLFCWCARNEL